MDRRLLLFIFIPLTSFIAPLHSQPTECGTVDFSTTCQTACVACGDIDGLMLTTLENMGGALPPNFCTAFSHTSSWLGFVAGSENLTLRVNVGNCTGIATEMGIYEGCDCSNFQLVSNCNTMMNQNTAYTFNNTVQLDVGKYYWLVFDGNGESACDVTFEVVSGSIGAGGNVQVGPIDGETTVCRDDIETYSIPEVGTCDYNWTLNGGGLFTTPTNSNVVDIQWTTEGEWELCVEPEIICGGSSQECILIQVEGEGDPTEIGPFLVCEGEGYNYNGEVYFDGTNEITLTSAAGCDSLVELEVEEVPNQEVFLFETICAPDCYQVGSEVYCEGGIYTNTLQQQNEPFCDSIIELELNVLEVDAIIDTIGSLGCANPSVILSSLNSELFGDGIIEYQWRDENGNIIGSDEEVEVFESGEYTLIITITAPDGTSCDDIDVIEIEGDALSPELDYPFQLFACANDSINLDTLSIVDFNDTGGDITFHSDLPADDTNELDPLTILPQEPTTIYVVSTIGGCRDVLEIDIQVGPDLFFDGSPIICQGQQINLSLLNIVDSNNTGASFTFHSDSPADPMNQLSDPVVSPDSTTTYFLLADNGACLDEIPIVIEVGDAIQFTLPDPGQINCNQDTALLDVGIPNPDDFMIEWTNANNDLLNPNGQPTVPVTSQGWYYISLVDTNSMCGATDSILVEEDYDLPALSTQDSSVFTCTDSIVQLTANTDFTFPNLVFGWYTPDGNILSDPDQGQIQVSSAGNYFFTIFNPDNGCADTVQQVVVPDQDLPVLSVDASSLELNCLVSQITLTADASTSTGGNVAYQWSTSNGNIPGSTTNGSIQISEPGIYSIEVLDPANNCVNSSSVTVTIDTVAPALSLQPDALIDCQQTSVSLAPLEGENTDLLYSWSTSDGVIIGDRNQYQIQTDAPGNYLLQVTNPDNGCLSIDSISVEQDAEIPNAFVAEPDVIDCQNTSIALNATQSDTGADFDLRWSTPDGNFSDLSNPTAPIVDQPGTYTLVVRNVSNNCVDSTTVIVQSNADLPVIQINTPDSLGCNTPQTTVNANISNATATSIQWSTPDGSILNGQLTPSILVNTSGTYVIQVENLDNGCITVDSVQVSGVATGPTSFDLFYRNPDCLTESAAFALSNVQGGQMPYTILLNSQAVPLNDTINIAPGNYIAQVVDANGCVLADTFQVNELPIYSANIGPDITITAGDNELLIPQFSFDTSLIEQINWFPNDAVSCDSCVVTEFIAPQTTELELVVNTEDGCSARANILITVLPARDVFIPSAFSPNADNINDFFTVFVSDERVRSIKRLQVFDRWGNQVFDNKDFPPNEQVLGWDGTFNGKELDPAVFIYAAEVEFIDGTVRLFSGDVTLVK